MAVSFSRWHLFREIVCNAKSGTLVAQIGPNYQYWSIEKGIISCVSSTMPEHTFQEFLIRNGSITTSKLRLAFSNVDEKTSLGAALFQKKIVESKDVEKLLREHWISTSETLFSSAAHIFWSDHSRSRKANETEASIPFFQLLLSCDRSCVEIRSAAEFAAEFPRRYQVVQLPMAVECLHPLERKVVGYLKRGASLDEILTEPDLDRITCYRVLFLLWLSGFLHEVRPQQKTASVESPRRTFGQYIRRIPPEWAVPFVVGVLLGLLLAPDPPQLPATPQRMERVLERPAWSK
ncbi:MAG: hypothetical protein C5B54_07360 [Acidobacteria bacterium]|nr:MAG: hypothetical protein C5B54_07360 [Acidobacteriota bacterium]